ncbi:glycoside hydrolase [Actinomadura barringtoniae]|uniref:Glycoside hydrolase n=1 Tax=Actinomadura barringtoniae TaxID=1427535 RepID=A0A939T4K5_9ACTN|nr:glycoside hydrolase family 38 C-terminal domain-containing protein [Actinomadura barringtoniae]MBO2452661.1 glycoside hydrolase [Actinomadura barringtoniae]
MDVEPTDVFIGGVEDPLQVVRVSSTSFVRITGEGVHGEGTGPEVGVRCEAPPGTVVPIVVTSGDRETVAELTVAEPGWTVWMVPHFHYDPVWWNTQAAYTTTWDDAGDAAQRNRSDFQQPGFELMRLHMEAARRDPDYKFVLAEVDYLKPYWDACPGDRAYLRRLMAEGRMELMGGTYNEPNTNLTSAESTIRNLVYGTGFQRRIMGGDPATAWQLDVFGHDPQFPALAADAGLTSSSWARGPFHQWGPMLTAREGGQAWADPRARMQFPAEFEWLAPGGKGVLTHYMPAHYSAGWWMDQATSLEDAEKAVFELFRLMRGVASTRNVLLPVGTDYTPPNRWVTEIQRDWNARYVWPRFVCALPSEFFAAVRAGLEADGRSPTPQTRDMNPVYTGKDVSFIDTKQAQRAAETLLVDAEKFATFAAATTGVPYPYAAFDKAWRQLAYGAHHDAITGSESDQVYLDLLTGWREAHDIGRDVLDASLRTLSAGHDGVVVFNPSSWPRTDLVRVDGGAFLAEDVPALGYRVFRPETVVGDADGWRPAAGTRISNETHAIEVDPARGGCVSSIKVDGRELLHEGRVGNELVVYKEYPDHPRMHEGPWHLTPSGPQKGSAEAPAASVAVETSSLGERITVTGEVGPVRYTQTLTLWYGLDRVDGVTHIDEFEGEDQLVRLRWPVRVPGALPVSEVAGAVIGRGFGLIDVDSKDHPWTLDNPAHTWFGLSSTARVRLAGGGVRAIGVAEVITTEGDEDGARDLALALVRAGVTSTCSAAPGARYGSLAFDSNLPDVRIAIGTPEQNPFVAEVLTPDHAAELKAQLAARGRARVWVPAGQALAKVWVPSADLTPARALPVLVIAGPGAVEDLVNDLHDATVEVAQDPSLSELTDPSLDDYTVALVNKGVPGFAVDSGGALHLSLMRSCTGWPSGVWIDPPRRTVPDGSNFQQQHWTHSFEYSLLAGPGDWRARSTVHAAHDVNHPLRAVVAAGGRDRTDSHSFLTVEPAEQIVLATLKPSGEPLARGEVPGPVEALDVRLHEVTGSAADVTVTTRLAETVAARVDGMEIATVRARLRTAIDPGTGREPWQPVYTRYWLNNTGPAPIGNLPVAVHLTDSAVTVASDLTEVEVDGEVKLIGPPGWTVEPGGVPYELPPGGHLEHPIRAVPPEDAQPGVYWLRARIIHDGQTFEDVARLVVGDKPPERELTVTLETQDVRLAPGETGSVVVSVASAVRTPIGLQAQLISPWQTFELFPVWNAGLDVPAGSEARLTFPVEVPPGTRPGRWWAVVKLAAAGSLHYTEAIGVEVTA